MAMNPMDDAGLDGLPLAGDSSLPPSRQARFLLRVIIAAGGLLLLYLLLDFLRSAYADLLWFSSLGVRDVFTTILVTRVVLFVVGLLVSAAALGGGYRFAFRHSWGPTVLPFSDQAIRWMRWSIIGGMIGIAGVVAFSFASALASRWEMFLKSLNSTPFGISDPQFGLDVSFYAFSLPVLHTIQGWLMGLAIVVLVTTAGIYMLIFSARGINPIITAASRNQVAVVGAFLMVTIAAAHFLDTYETLFSPTGAVTGATYADVTARLPALRLLTFVALVSGAIMLLSMRVENIRQSMRMLLAAFGLWVVAALIAGLGWPALVQRFAVDPSELQRERPYIERNIAWTRMGYDLERISERPYDVKEETLADDIANNPETINNIRLWDPRPLEDVYNQIQHLRLYYNFLDVDVDRYVIDGEYRQVLVGSREIFQIGLDDTAQNWVNRRLVYTHGFGVVMATATDFTESGQPNLVVQDIPPVGAFPITQPRIYYGESFGRDASTARLAPGLPATGIISDDAVVVNTNEPQFDRPADGASILPLFIDRYDGAGGVMLSSLFRRIVYAWDRADVNLLFSRQLTPDSKILYRRSIRERVGEVVPFLELDDDPYLVVDDGGLFWIQDAYVTTDNFPYSRRLSAEQLANSTFARPLNYIRNNVKVVVDAHNGSMVFYTIELGDPDPILSTYRSIFPNLFTPISQMPPSLREHIRYPEELLRAQAELYLQYHMADPKEFFLKEDQWELAQEITGSEGNLRIIQPYYVIMKLPGEDTEEFVLVLPFTPQDKQNLVAWMAARSDGQHYGEITTFEFPKDRLFNGPGQIEARIDNDPVISEQFTLWGQSGSRVIRGNLLVIPIGEALLYAEPIYIQAESLAFPELKRVILATNDDVVMEASLDEAVRAILGGRVITPPTHGEPVADGIPPEELRRVLDDVRGALDALRGGTQELDASIEALLKLAGEGAQ